MNERSDIEFPVWRKKVDHSFLNEKVTPIPKWLWSIWKIEETLLEYCWNIARTWLEHCWNIVGTWLEHCRHMVGT